MKENKPCKSDKKHKWEYYEINDTYHEHNKAQFRVCRKCHHAQVYKYHFYKYIWSYIMWYTQHGAKHNIKGYGEL